MYSETFLRNTSSFFIFFKKAPPPQYTHAAATVRALRAFENAPGLAVGCPQSVESAVQWAFEDASRTTEACFWHRISLPYRRSLFFTPNASENASRTGGGLFEHGTHIRYRRGPFPVPSAVEGAGEGSAAAEPGALRQVAAAAEPGAQRKVAAAVERAAMSQAR